MSAISEVCFFCDFMNICHPDGRPGSRPFARKAKEFGFRARTADLKIRRIPTGNAGRPIHIGGARRPGSAPVKRCPKVKFKLTIQSENLRLNSKCFYHYKAD